MWKLRHKVKIKWNTILKYKETIASILKFKQEKPNNNKKSNISSSTSAFCFCFYFFIQILAPPPQKQIFPLSWAYFCRFLLLFLILCLKNKHILMQSRFHCSLGHPYSPCEDVRLSVIHHTCRQTLFTTRYPNGDFFFFKWSPHKHQPQLPCRCSIALAICHISVLTT